MIHYNGRGKTNPFFQYKDARSSDGGDGESITHEYIKNIISNLEILNIQHSKKEIKIYVKNSYVEYRVDCEEGNYILDIFFEFEKSKPQYYFDKWRGVLAVEIFVSHKTENGKVEALKKNGIPVFEVNVKEKYYLEKCYENEKKLNNKIAGLKTMYGKKIYGKLLSDPESEFYKTKKVNNELTSEISKCKTKSIERREQSQIKYKDYESNFKRIDEENGKLKKENIRLKIKNKEMKEKIKIFESKKFINKLRNFFKK
jgi:hypothetical protein